MERKCFVLKDKKTGKYVVAIGIEWEVLVDDIADATYWYCDDIKDKQKDFEKDQINLFTKLFKSDLDKDVDLEVVYIVKSVE